MSSRAFEFFELLRNPDAITTPMKKIGLIISIMCGQSLIFGQESTPIATPSPNTAATRAAATDVETLRQQVAALTEMVKTLQQQVKDQQAAMEKANLVAVPLPEKSASPAPAATPPSLFQTTDESVA